MHACFEVIQTNYFARVRGIILDFGWNMVDLNILKSQLRTFCFWYKFKKKNVRFCLEMHFYMSKGNDFSHNDYIFIKKLSKNDINSSHLTIESYAECLDSIKGI